MFSQEVQIGESGEVERLIITGLGYAYYNIIDLVIVFEHCANTYADICRRVQPDVHTSMYIHGCIYSGILHVRFSMYMHIAALVSASACRWPQCIPPAHGRGDMVTSTYECLHTCTGAVSI